MDDFAKFLIVMGAFGIAAVALLAGLVAQWLVYRHRKQALETLKAFAENGRDPPPELLAAVSRPMPGWGDAFGGDMLRMQTEKPRVREPGRSLGHALLFAGVGLPFVVMAYLQHQPLDHKFWITGLILCAVAITTAVYAFIAARFLEK